MTLKIDLVESYDAITILFNGILHIRFLRSELVAIQSWRDLRSKFVIEFTFKTGASFTAEYDSAEKFEGVLNAIQQLPHW